MRYYEYTIHCGKMPSKITLHAIASHFFKTKDLTGINFKVKQESKLVKIVTDKLVNEDFSVTLTNTKGISFECRLLHSKSYETPEVKMGQQVLLSGIIEYGINLTGKKGKKCPFFLGRFESSELQQKFKENIERSLGVSVPSMSKDYFSRLESEHTAVKHVQFNNIIDIELPVVVRDADLFVNVFFKAQFQKKSYGFGNLEVVKIIER